MLWAIITLILLIAAAVTIVVTAALFVTEWAQGKEKMESDPEEDEAASPSFHESGPFGKVPGSAIAVTCLDGSAVRGMISGVSHSCWRADNLLYFVPCQPQASTFTAYQKDAASGCAIPIGSIVCFKRDGVISYETQRAAQVSDGHLAPGQAVVAHDTRHAQLIFRDPSGKEAAILFTEVAYYAFTHLIPEKEHKPAAATSKKPSIEELLASMEQTAVFDDAALRREGSARRRRTDQVDQPAT